MLIPEVATIAQAADFIERQLVSNTAGQTQYQLALPAVAGAVGYSPFHLHRMFAEIAGLTIHAYVLRRQLTEAARLLVFSEQPLIEIAMRCGYASQQSFTVAFRTMYKLPPAEYRKGREFYPLQLPLRLQADTDDAPAMRLAEPADIPAWLDLARQAVAGYPHWHEDEYCRRLRAAIAQRQALVMPAGQGLAAALAFSTANACIDFLAVQPQFRRQGRAKLLLQKLRQDILPRRELCTTTFRAGDKAENGQRIALQRLGFAEDAPLVEFGYPTQRFVLPKYCPAAQNEVNCYE